GCPCERGWRRHGGRQAQTGGAGEEEDGEKEMEAVGARVEMPTTHPIVLLKEPGGERSLPIWIGPMEATAIAFAQQGMVPARPLTHDLMRDILQALKVEL